MVRPDNHKAPDDEDDHDETDEDQYEPNRLTKTWLVPSRQRLNTWMFPVEMPRPQVENAANTTTPVGLNALPPATPSASSPTAPTKQVVLEPRAFGFVWMTVFALRFMTILSLIVYLWYLHWLGQDTFNQESWRRDVHTLPSKSIRKVNLVLFGGFCVHFFSFYQMVYFSFAERKLVFAPTRRPETRSVRSVASAAILPVLTSRTTTVMPSDSPRNTHPTANLLMPMNSLAVVLSSSGHASERDRAASVANHAAPTTDLIGHRHGEFWLRATIRKLLEGIKRSVQVILLPLEWSFKTLDFLSMQSEWFDEVFAIRETIELATQTIQVYRMHCLISNDLINAVGVTAICLNCLSIGLIEYVTKEYRHKTIGTRCILMIVDACLDFVFAIAIPLGIQLSVAYNFNFSKMRFEEDQLNDDLWYPNAIHQFQQFSLSSSWDTISMVVFQLGLLFCLLEVQGIVARSDQISASARYGAKRINSHRITRRKSSVVSLAVSYRSIKRVVLKVTPIFHALVGALVLFASIYARFATHQPVQGCKLSGYEWFKPHSVCSVMEINCFRREIAGANAEIDGILRGMDTKWLFTLIFSHCDALEIPQAIQRIPSLYMIELYNSTLMEWSTEAAVTQATNPQLTLIYFYRTTFLHRQVPPGILSENLPHWTTVLAFVDTNLHDLPQEALQSWRFLSTLYMEHGVLTEIPSVVSQLTSIRLLSLVNNSITHIAEEDLRNLRLEALKLSGNPLQTLPERLPFAVVQDVWALHLESTWLTSLPEWLVQLLRKYDRQKVEISAFGSPLCSNRVTRSLLVNGSMDATMHSIEWLTSRCLFDMNTVAGATAVELIDHQRNP